MEYVRTLGCLLVVTLSDFEYECGQMGSTTEIIYWTTKELLVGTVCLTHGELRGFYELEVTWPSHR